MPAPQALLSPAHRTDDERRLSADDPSAIRLLALPEVGPPFDDDLAASTSGDTVAPHLGAAALGREPAAPRRAAARTRAETQPDAEWARQFARLLTEALSGARPVRQILPWTSERARVQMRALMPLFAGGQRPRVLRVIATKPTRDVIEMTVVAGMGARARALAVRLERADPAQRPAWPGQAARFRQPQLTALATQASRPGKAATATAAPRWLCTDIEAA
jgi:Family of unknown function (DUF6459)